jgi:hypothetical protein
MRSLAYTALLGSFIATGLAGQSLTEHAAAAAGATIGTAAGKPLGTSLGKIFGDVDKTTSTATTSKAAKPIVVKSATPAAAPEGTVHTATVVIAPSGGGGEGAAGGGSGAGNGATSRHSARRRELPAQPEPVATQPVEPAPIVIQAPVFKEPTAQDIANIHVGVTSSELHALFGAPESKVSIPEDDGHLLEICQYWARGEQVGTVRLENGRVVSVQAIN